MKFISVIYIQKRNFWCMTRGGNQQKIFHLQKVDGEQSGSQKWRKTSKCLEKNIYTLIIPIKEQLWRVFKLNFDILSFLRLSTNPYGVHILKKHLKSILWFKDLLGSRELKNRKYVYIKCLVILEVESLRK